MKSIRENKGRFPTNQEIQDYIGAWTESRLDGFRTEANQVLSQFAGFIITQERPRILEAALKERSFLRDAGVAFAGAFIYTLALISAAFVLKFLQH
jgi:hypothetical protein